VAWQRLSTIAALAEADRNAREAETIGPMRSDISDDEKRKRPSESQESNGKDQPFAVLRHQRRTTLVERHATFNAQSVGP